jgi:cytosine/adenosine deaminase-related metal-dependent hydrolase
VLLEDGRISAVAERIDAPGAEVLDATGMLVLPGFVDTHRHTWQALFRGIGADWTFAEYGRAMHGVLRPLHRPEDVLAGTLLGRLEALHSGVTTLLDWCHCTDTPAHGDAALDALRQAPGRSVFCYGAGVATDGPVAAELARMRGRIPGDDALVTMAAGLRGPQRTSIETTAADDELAMLADAGCSVSISPDVELKMGFGWPETGRMLAAGIRPTLSIDDTPSAGGDMFSTMRTALSVQRGLDTAQGRPPSLTARDVLEFATVDGARALGFGDRAGSITPGKQADLLLLRADDLTLFPANHPVGAILSAGHPGLVDTVLVAGEVVKRGGALVGVDLDELRERALRSRTRIAAAAGIPLDGTWVPA